MKIDTIKCDRCNSIFTQKELPEFKLLSKQHIEQITRGEEHGALYLQYNIVGFDLCNKCINELKQWVYSYRQNNREVHE